jgi:hypothetical protein
MAQSKKFAAAAADTFCNIDRAHPKSVAEVLRCAADRLKNKPVAKLLSNRSPAVEKVPAAHGRNFRHDIQR